MDLNKAPKLLVLPNLAVYLYLFIRQYLNETIYTNFNQNELRSSNIVLLNSLYIYETFVAALFNRSILYNWKLHDYFIHHLSSAFFLIKYYNNGPSLDAFFTQTQKYIIFANSNEIISLFQNFNMSKKNVAILKIYSLYNIIHLIYYEIKESYIYYKNTPKKKHYVLFPLLAALYHIFIVIPTTIKFLQKNIYLKKYLY